MVAVNVNPTAMRIIPMIISRRGRMLRPTRKPTIKPPTTTMPPRGAWKIANPSAVTPNPYPRPRTAGVITIIGSKIVKTPDAP